MQNKKVKIFLDYLPAITTAFLAVVTIILYATFISEKKTSAYLAVAFIPLLPLVLTFLNRKQKLGFPRYLIILICLHIVLSVYAGTAMGAYQISWWDLLMHGYFGFLCCAALYYLYIRFENGQPKWRHLVMFIILTIGIATGWEIYEYVADLFLHSDMQGIESAIEQGIPPLTDTITDIIIAIVGAVVFYVFLWIKNSVEKIRKAKQPADENTAELR